MVFLGTRRLAPVVQRALHLWFRLSRGMTLGVRIALLDDRQRVFLVRHTYVDGWHMPGGGVEVGEDALSAARRELVEEAAAEMTEPPRLHGVFFNGRVSRRDHVVVYVARAFRMLGTKRPDREIAEAGFFALDDLPPATTRATRARLDEIASGRPAATTW